MSGKVLVTLIVAVRVAGETVTGLGLMVTESPGSGDSSLRL